MVFNSFAFLIFFSLFFAAYWFLLRKNAAQQNTALLLGSYVFYAWADLRFLGFLVAVSLLNFALAIGMVEKPKFRKWFFRLGLLQGLLCLFLFKYLDFFILMLQKMFSAFHLQADLPVLQLMAPLGISFFTFRMLSYLMDVYNEKLEPSRDWRAFFSYVAFFPSLLSGPIDKAQLLLPQLSQTRKFEYNEAADGMRQILWGLFKKVVIANTLAGFTSVYFGSYTDYGASTLVLAAVLFTFQLYADFSGYSDMAIGVSRLLGLRITKNFAYPFFAQNIADFWRRWHISLTSWLTEYVFTPLSIFFRDWANAGLIAAILINFLLVGIWHGANWTYVVFGLLHGVYYIPLILSGQMNKRKKLAKDRLLPSWKEAMNMILTFGLFAFSLILFRSEDLPSALDFMKRCLSSSLFEMPAIPLSRLLLIQSLFFIALMLAVEWVQREKEHGLVLDKIKNASVRMLIYYAILLVLIAFGAWGDNAFIYFKF